MDASHRKKKSGRGKSKDEVSSILAGSASAAAPLSCVPETHREGE